MDNGFGSINDLIKKDDASVDETQAQQKAQVALQKKMKNIKKQELETEAKRDAAAGGNLYPYIDLKKFPVGHEALKFLPEEKAQELHLVCFYKQDHQIRFGAIDPRDEAVQAYVKEQEEETQDHIALYKISENSFQHVAELYKTLPKVVEISKDVEVDAEELERIKNSITDHAKVQELLSKATTTDIVSIIMGAGMQLGSSDVHIETEKEKISVRLRVDGVLQEVATIDKEKLKQLLGRLKLIASLKINVTNVPQDGRFTIKMPDGEVDVRVSTIPTVYGESVVMRLLKQNQKGLTLETLGVRGKAYDLLAAEIQRPNGMILTTGPTGSGKTTTLYSILKMLNKPGVKILTLEDPVEYRMDGINQSQIDHSKDYTFSKGLRSILRQDPDIVMVGEIRDLETAEIAVKSALTGHLMLSTVHTNNAAGAIPRMLSMGVKPFLLTPALNVVIGQRLVRKIVEEHRVEKHLKDYSSEMQEKVQKELDSLPEEAKQGIAGRDLMFYAAKEGVDESDAYKGRMGLYEIFSMTDGVQELLSSGNTSEYDMQKVLAADGMVTMVQDGILKALDGITTLEEVYRVVD